jgi:hypothetical protein
MIVAVDASRGVSPMARRRVESLLVDAAASETERPLRKALLWLIVVLICCGPVLVAEFRRPVPFGPDGHAVASLDIAVGRVFCGALSTLSPAMNRVALEVIRNPQMLDRSLRDIVETLGPGRDGYCASLTVPFVNNENSLMLLETATLKLAPGASVRTIGQALWLAKAAMAAVLVLALLLAGAPVTICGILFYGSLTIALSLESHHYSEYSLILPAVLVNIGAAAIAVRYRAGTRLPRLLALCLLGGIIAAFATNVRTSVAPICVAVWALGIVFTCAVRPASHDGTRLRTYARMLAGGAAFVLGFALFWFTLIRPISQQTVPFNNVNHTVSHPLVLSLALPGNDLAVREGIEWDDLTGQVLAQRVDPTATYLGPGYESALYHYYFGLWKKYPADMIGVYQAKFEMAGRALIRGLGSLANGAMLWEALLFPLRQVTNGIVVLLLLLAATIVSARETLRSGRPAAAAVAMIASAGLLTQLESSILVPGFVLQYHSVELFALGALCLAAGQVVVERIAAAMSGASGVDRLVAVKCGAVAAVVSAIVAVATEAQSTGSITFNDLMAKAALSFGAFVAMAFLAASFFVGRTGALSVAIGCALMTLGITSGVDFAVATAVIGIVLSVAAALRVAEDGGQTAPALAWAGVSAGLAVSFGADVVLVAMLLLAGGIVAARPLFSRAGAKALAGAVAAALFIAFMGGLTEFGRAPTWATVLQTVSGVPLRGTSPLRYRVEPRFADVFGDFGLASLSNGGTGGSMHPRGLPDDVIGYRLAGRSAWTFPATLLGKWSDYALSRVAAVPGAVAQTIDRAAPLRRLRGRLPMARFLALVCLYVAPVVLILIASARRRIGAWLFLAWGYLVGIAPVQGDVAAIVTVVFTGTLTLAALVGGAGAILQGRRSVSPRRALGIALALAALLVIVRITLPLFEAARLSALRRTYSSVVQREAAAEVERPSAGEPALDDVSVAVVASGDGRMVRTDWVADWDFSQCTAAAADLVLRYKVLDWPGLIDHRVHVEKGEPPLQRWLTFFPVYAMNRPSANPPAAGSIQLAQLDVDGGARQCLRGVHRVDGIDPFPTVMQMQFQPE